MLRVPVLQRHVRERPLPSGAMPVPPASAFGAEQAGAVSGVGDVLTRAGASGLRIAYSEMEAAKARADETAVYEGDNDLASWELGYLHDAEKGALHVRGKSAAGLIDHVREEFNKTADTIRARLVGDRQQQAFRRRALARWERINATVQQHTARELHEFEVTETVRGIGLATSAAVQNFFDPMRVKQELDDGRAKVSRLARLTGLGPDAAADETLKFTTGVHDGVIAQLLTANQPKQAEIWYEAAKDQITGAAQAPIVAKIQKANHETSIRGDAQRQADAIIRAGGKLQDQREKAKAIADPEVRDRALDYIEHEANLREKAERDDGEADLLRAYNLAEQGGLAAVQRATRADGSSLWLNLKGSSRSELRSYVRVRATGATVKTDMGALYTLLTLSSTNPNEFLTTNLLDYRNKLSDGDLEQMMRLQAQKREGKPAGEIFASEGLQNEIIDTGLRQMFGPDWEKKMKSDPDLSNRVGAFRRAVREGVEREHPGTKATRPDIQAVVDTLVAPTQRYVDGWFSNTPARYAFETAQAQVKSVADVPPGERQKIEASLRRKGIAVTDAEIVKWFNEKLQRVRGDR